MRTPFNIALFAGLLLWAMNQSPLATAQEAPAARIASLVRTLNDDSLFRVQQAAEELVSAGPEAHSYLLEASRTGNTTLKQRADDILRQRRAQSVWLPSVYPATTKQATLADAQHWFMSRMGQPMTRHDLANANQLATIGLPAKPLPLLHIAQLLTDQLGQSPGTPTASNKQLCSASPVAGRAYSGPLMLEITRATQHSQTHELTLYFRLVWEPGFALASHAERPTRVFITWGEVSQQHTLELPLAWRPVDRQAQSLRATVTVPLTTPVEGLTAMKVEWPLFAAATEGVVNIQQPAQGNSLLTPAGEITVDQWQPGQAIVRVDNIRSWPVEPAELMRSYQWEMLGASPAEVNQFELTATGARWHLHSPPNNTTQGLMLHYRAEFTRKNLAFLFEQVDVSGD